MKTSHGELRQSVFDANQELVRAGLVVLTFGNASGADRRSGVMAIKPSGIPYDRLRPDDMVVIDLESGHVVDGENNPSSDTPTHLVLYREFGEIGGVVHTHSPFATAWAQAQRDLPCLGTTHADHFFGSVPVTRPLTSDEVDRDYEEHTGDVIVERFEDLGLDPAAMPAALVASHGPFVWG
jgi:L-ribulose-5-phosphate 4-epimerase